MRFYFICKYQARFSREKGRDRESGGWGGGGGGERACLGLKNRTVLCRAFSDKPAL